MRAIWTHVRKKEEEFLKSYIGDSFRPFSKGVRDFDASSGFKKLQGSSPIVQGLSTPILAFARRLPVEVH